MPERDDPQRWTPFGEPLRNTLLRTGTLALVLGSVMFVAGRRRVSWPVSVIVALWPAFGGHWIELWFLNWVRPRITPARAGQVIARLAVWSAGGIGLTLMMRETARVLSSTDIPWLTIRVGAVAFIAVEMVVHAVITLRGMPSFYNGRG